MRITIVHGFFLPIPPLAGGAMEKIWWRLAQEFVARGHEVVSFSRRWPGLPDCETRSGVQLVRLPGRDHTRRLALNLLHDALWSLRVARRLPSADILVTNNVALPALAPVLRPDAGRVVANLNRFPKHQVRTWRRIARLQAASPAIAAAVRRQAPMLADRIRVTPNPIDLEVFHPNSLARSPDAPVVFGFTGRLHPEKGLDFLAHAARRLAETPGLPPWRIVLRGPDDVPRGGGGPAFAQHLLDLAGLPARDGRFVIEPPVFDPTALAKTYRDYDVFLYPTQAEHGEALPVAVLEAQASGLPVIATDLPCFSEYLKNDYNAGLLPLGASADTWAAAMTRLLLAPERRAGLARHARLSVSALDFRAQADAMLDDFASLLTSR